MAMLAERAARQSLNPNAACDLGAVEKLPVKFQPLKLWTRRSFSRLYSAMLKANHKKYTLRGHGKRAWRHVSQWTWSLISLFEVSTGRHRPTCSYELCFQLRLPILLLRVMLGCIALLRLKRQNQFLQLPGVEDVIMKMSYFKGFFSTLHVAMKCLVHFYLYMEYTSRPACLIALLWIRCYVPLVYLNRSLPFNKPVTGAMTTC